jgi:hypothetical protein
MGSRDRILDADAPVPDLPELPRWKFAIASAQGAQIRLRGLGVQLHIDNERITK